MKHLKSLLILTLCSCASIPDTWVCRARSANTGFCTKTISDQSQIVSDETPLMLQGKPKTWIDLKIESVYVPAESWADIKGFIIKKCKKNQDCSANIGTWEGKIDSVNPN